MRNNHAFFDRPAGSCHFPAPHTNAARTTRMMPVRTSEAKSASTPSRPTLAKTAVSAANTADRSAQVSQSADEPIGGSSSERAGPRADGGSQRPSEVAAVADGHGVQVQPGGQRPQLGGQGRGDRFRRGPQFQEGRRHEQPSPGPISFQIDAGHEPV